MNIWVFTIAAASDMFLGMELGGIRTYTLGCESESDVQELLKSLTVKHGCDGSARCEELKLTFHVSYR